MNRNQIRQSLPVIVVVLSGCATTTDPREGDLFTSIWNLSTGVYEQRIKDLLANQGAARQKLIKLEQDMQKLQDQEVATDRELQQRCKDTIPDAFDNNGFFQGSSTCRGRREGKGVEEGN